jgi:hypothetical protein
MISFQALYDESARWENTIVNLKDREMSAVRLRVKQTLIMRKHLKRSWLASSTKQSKYYDIKHIIKKYVIDDMIYLCVKNIKSIRSFKKLDYKYYKSYAISMLVDKIFYRLNLSVNMRKIYNVFHVSLLKSHNSEVDDEKQALSIDIDDEEQWEIQNILNSRKFHDKLQYYVKWLSYDDTHNEWVKTNDMSNAQQLIFDYHLNYSEQVNEDRVAKKRRVKH